jgi:hypothetical protein
MGVNQTGTEAVPMACKYVVCRLKDQARSVSQFMLQWRIRTAYQDLFLEPVRGQALDQKLCLPFPASKAFGQIDMDYFHLSPSRSCQ